MPAAGIRSIAAALFISLAAHPQVKAQSTLEPAFDIWDAELGAPVSSIPVMEVVNVACGTNGGPPSIPLRTFDAFHACTPEPSGLREVYFEYDDEQDYIARANEEEYRFLQRGTSVYGHPVVVSVLVDDAATIRGIRIVTDEHASVAERASAVSLAGFLKGRYGAWELVCDDIPPGPGESPMGRQFEHRLCQGSNPQSHQAVLLESSYFRKKGQEPLNRETQEVNSGYFQSQTRLEVVQSPYLPSPTP